MTPTAAYKAFWQSFGVPAFDDQNIDAILPPPALPYLLYQSGLDYFGHPLSLSANIWAEPVGQQSATTTARKIVDKIAERLGPVGAFVPFDGGAIHIKRGHPWAQPRTDPESSQVKGWLVNLEVEFIR